MTNDIATQQQLTPNFDWLDGGSSADRPPFLKYRQGSWYCRPLTNDQDLDITGSLFAAAMPTFRQTRVAWTDESSTPVEEHAAYLALGQRLPTTYTDYPIRANGQDAWSDGFQIDGMLYVSGEWHQATLTTQTVTSNIQIRQAMQLVRKTAGRTYSLADWTPVFELGKPEQIKSKAGGNIKVPNFVFRGFIDATGDTGAAGDGADELSGAASGLVGRIPTDPNTQAPFMLPEIAAEPARPMGSNTQTMLASGIAVPQSPGGGSVSNDMNDEIPF